MQAYEISPSMEFTDPEHPLASAFVRTLMHMRATSLAEGKKVDEDEFNRLIDDANEPIRERIKTAMANADKTIDDVAYVFGLKTSRAYDYRRRPSELSREQTAKLLTLLGIGIDELRGEPSLLTPEQVYTMYDYLPDSDRTIISGMLCRLYGLIPRS